MSAFGSTTYTTPYSTARYGWRFINYMYMLANRPATSGLVLRPSSAISLKTLRQKVLGGRHWVATSDDPMAEDTKALAALAQETMTKMTLESCVLIQREGFQRAWTAAPVVTFPYLNTLKVIDNFIVGRLLTMSHATVPMSAAAQEALSEYLKARPVIKQSVVGDSFVHLTK